jgi:hypothetical protein
MVKNIILVIKDQAKKKNKKFKSKKRLVLKK